MRYELRSIAVWPFIKVAFFFNLVVGFLVGLIYIPVVWLFTAASQYNAWYDRPGPDFEVFGESANDDFIQVEVSSDGTRWHALPKVPESSNGLDLGKLAIDAVAYVRLTDVQPATPT